MDQLPIPLTPPDCDLTDFQYMELDVRRLRDSKFATVSDGESFRAAILLWCAAWHQVPAASLPDDDIELAHLAGYGRVIKEWRKVRAVALHGFIKCSDGRLYHPVIAEKALSAYESKGKYAYSKFLERMRKENARRDKEGKPLFGIPTREQWNSGLYPHGIPPEITQTNERIPPENANCSTGIPPENALRGNGTERNGTELLIHSVAKATVGGADDPPTKTAAELTKDELWKAGKSLLAEAGLPKPQCGSFVGKLVKDYGDVIVIEAVRTAVVVRPADPVEYLKATCMHAFGQRKKPNAQEALEAANAAVLSKFLAEDAHAAQ